MVVMVLMVMVMVMVIVVVVVVMVVVMGDIYTPDYHCSQYIQYKNCDIYHPPAL